MKPFRHLMILLLVLVYTGQSLAAIGTPCLMMGSSARVAAQDATTSDTDMAQMTHAGHHMSGGDPVAEEEGSLGCCDGGLCSMSHCQASLALLQSHPDGALGYVAIYRSLSPKSSHPHSQDSLYRPPISR